MGNYQRIRDPVHNLIKFDLDNKYDKLLWDLIQTAPFQRLRHIKQLGFSDFVYPGASHSRFSHSLGVMEMARKMVSALEANGVYLPDEYKRAAIITAALLHDVGHGPFSHVFEEVSREVNVDKSHEEYTKEIIGQSEIGSLLKRVGIQKDVLAFFDEKLFPLGKDIISSQIDADRLDFLQRDQHFTGIRFGSIDIEWLLDSIRVEKDVIETDDNDATYFYFDHKGLRVLEEYVAAYTKIYVDVYFHKTTRAVQHLVTDALKVCLQERKKLGSKFGITSLLFDYFDADEEDRLGIYLNLTDQTIIELLRNVSMRGVGNVQDICLRYFNRDLYKCIEITKNDRSHDALLVSNFLNELKKQKIEYKMDKIPPKGYKQYDPYEKYLENILVQPINSNRKTVLHELSPVVKSLSGSTPIRIYFKNSILRNEAKKIYDALHN